MTILKVKERIDDIITKQSGDSSVKLKQMFNKMNIFKKIVFINYIAHFVSLDIRQGKVLKQDILFAIDDYLFSSEEYIKEYFN